MEERKPLSTIKAIRAKCLDCATTSNEVRLCPVKQCPIWVYRFGKNPYRKGREWTEEERRAVAERLASYRKEKTVTEDDEQEEE